MQINILMIKNLGKKKNNVSRMNAIMYTIIKQIKNISILLFPIIPIAT